MIAGDEEAVLLNLDEVRGSDEGFLWAHSHSGNQFGSIFMLYTPLLTFQNKGKNTRLRGPLEKRGG